MTASDTTHVLMADLDGERLDTFVSRTTGLTRSRVQRLIQDGMVSVEGASERASYRLSRGQHVAARVPPPQETAVSPERIALDVIYEDGDVIAINKPPRMTVHPSPGHSSATLVNAILAHCSDLSGVGGVLRPGIVHRLDRDTSGIILIAKNDDAHHALAKQLKERTVEKIYLALVEGTPRPAEGIVDAPIARDPRSRQRMAIVEGGRPSITSYRVVERLHGCSLVEARPKTGRTHQIRVHLAAIGHPIVGDRVYGKPSMVVGRQFLHASRIEFKHPRTGEQLRLEASLPPDLETALSTLRAG